MKRIFLISLRWLLPWIFLFYVIPKMAPFFDYKVDLRETFKKQVESKGVTLIDTKPAVFLTQEYPDVEGIDYRESINLTVNPALMNWKKETWPFWVGIKSNLEIRNYRNTTLFLNFKGKVDVEIDPEETGGWVEVDPDHAYYIRLKNDIQPLMHVRISPLLVKFPKEGIYFVQYGISGDNEIPTGGVFPIEVHKRIVIKKVDTETQ